MRNKQNIKEDKMNKKPIFSLLVLTVISFFFLSPAYSASISKWWDKFGEPKYCDTITLRTTALVPSFDMNMLVVPPMLR